MNEQHSSDHPHDHDHDHDHDGHAPFDRDPHGDRRRFGPGFGRRFGHRGFGPHAGGCRHDVSSHRGGPSDTAFERGFTRGYEAGLRAAREAADAAHADAA